jgi:ribosomal protein S3AE
MAFPFAGLKKQLNKANQYMSERITGVEGTKLNNEFQDMERRTDLFNELVEDLQVSIFSSSSCIGHRSFRVAADPAEWSPFR